MPSLSFLGNETSYLRIPNSPELNFGTGDFTITWYQYQTDSNSFPRIFQKGTYGTGISIGVSIEEGIFYYWTNGRSRNVKHLVPSDYKNQWVHFAISRASGITQVFMNGISVFTMPDANDFNSVYNLTISNESVPSSDTAFGGLLYYFSWVKGVALYTSNFTVPTITSDYVLLLTASSFDGTLGNTVINNDVHISSMEPPPMTNDPPVSIATPAKKIYKSRFTNNAMVFYKPGSLAPGGVGTVSNASIKARRT